MLQNCFEHAFQDCEHGHIVISMSSNNGFCRIGVIDDGKGFNIEECSQKSLGLSIVNSYVEDKLKESMQFESTACGTTVSFTFKI
ncbi:MAG: ATP-binding protein [Bacillota bacterium]